MDRAFALAPVPPDMSIFERVEWHYAEGDRAAAGSAQRTEHYRLAAELAASEAARHARNARKRRREVRRCA